MYRYKLSNDSLQLWGFENPTTVIRNSHPELILKFPVSYGDIVKDYYQGNGRYCERFSLSTMGTIESVADAYGMMILPNQDTLRNVLRIKSVKRIAEDMHVLEQGGNKEKVSTDSSYYYLLRLR